MPYLTWEYMAEFVEGEKRLKEDIVRRAEDADEHPFFDEKEAVVQRLVDSAMDSAGYETPLDEITDTALKNAAAGILVGLLTETSSSREAWMENVHKAGLKYLENVASGDIVLIGVTTDTEAGDTGEIHGRLADEPMFDDPTGESAFNRAFPPLAPPRGWTRY